MKLFKSISNPLFLLVYITSFLMLNPHAAYAQMFTLESGAITSTMSDSRSVNFLDLNNDGFQEVFISNGLAGGQKDLLYTNIAGGILISTGNMDIVDAENPADGASFADYNNDGHIDGMVSSWYGAEDLLYLNNGSGRLNYNGNAGIDAGSHAETASFGDYDNDGWLDIYVTHSGGNLKNFLYRNLRNGKFEKITNHILVNDFKPSRAALWGDFNDDGHQDLFVTNENNNRNDLFYGSGDGNFEKLSSGGIVTSSKGSMTASWGDIDNDGDLDLFVGNAGFFSGQTNQLFKNNGSSFSSLSNDPVTEDNKCTFGSAFADFDNDGDLDLAVANGFCNQGMANDLFENQGDGTFKKVSQLLVSNNNICSFGLAWGDINNDGFLELVIANCKNNNADIEHPNTLYKNQGNGNNWLQVSLTGVESNTSAIGAKLMILALIDGKEVWQRRDVSSQSGYAGQNSLVSHFGLGDAAKADSLIIYWPSGNVDIFSDVDNNQILKITESMTNNVAEINQSPQIEFTVFPNPMSSRDSSLHVRIQSEKIVDEAEIIVTDMLGQRIHSKIIRAKQGETNVILPITNHKMGSGIYNISLNIDGQSMSRQLFISE